MNSYETQVYKILRMSVHFCDQKDICFWQISELQSYIQI